MACLTLNNVSFGYQPRQPVVCDFSATLQPGQVTALIGPNAAGKSTLMRLMLGQLQPDTGTLQLNGQSVAAMKPTWRAGMISYVPQRGSASFAFTVRQIVAMGRYAHEGPDGIEEAIHDCELGTLEHRVFSDLSGGQQQRVLIARAMAQSAGTGQVMLLDEPGASLDLRHVRDLMTLLRRQAQAGLAVLVVLHDLNLAARYADVVWLMEAGRLAARGTWDQVMLPAILEPVYGVGLEQITSGQGDPGQRPLLMTRPMQ